MPPHFNLDDVAESTDSHSLASTLLRPPNHSWSVSDYTKQRRKFFSEQQWREKMRKLETSATVYVGNLTHDTTEEQVYELFAHAGAVRRIIMGLHKRHKTPCGFCFVQFHTHTEALHARFYLDASTLDGRTLSVEIDEGFTPGRQFGKAATGSQVGSYDAMKEKEGLAAKKAAAAAAAKSGKGGGGKHGQKGKGGWKGKGGGGGGGKPHWQKKKSGGGGPHKHNKPHGGGGNKKQEQFQQALKRKREENLPADAPRSKKQASSQFNFVNKPS